MKESIENIWENGFLQEPISPPKVTDFYNQKSIHFVRTSLNSLKKEVNLLIPIAIGVFLLNIVLDNHYSIVWGIICGLPCLVFFYVGKKQIASIESIDFGDNCYDYVRTVLQKMKQLDRYNLNLTIATIIILVLPMLVYTVIYHSEKTIGEIFSIEGFDWRAVTVFLSIPIIGLITYFVTLILFKNTYASRNGKLEALIKDMEELRA